MIQSIKKDHAIALIKDGQVLCVSVDNSAEGIKRGGAYVLA